MTKCISRSLAEDIASDIELYAPRARYSWGTVRAYCERSMRALMRQEIDDMADVVFAMLVKGAS